jgi:hypothetical protein
LNFLGNPGALSCISPRVKGVIPESRIKDHGRRSYNSVRALSHHYEANDPLLLKWIQRRTAKQKEEKHV